LKRVATAPFYRTVTNPDIWRKQALELKVTERFRRLDSDHMELDFILEDPKALVKPWTSTFYLQRRDNCELGEISCSGDYLQFSKFEK